MPSSGNFQEKGTDPGNHCFEKLNVHAGFCGSYSGRRVPSSGM